VDRIEQWIKRKLAVAVADGNGQWVNSPESALGRPIYKVTAGPVTLVLSELGFKYEGPTPPIECRYEDVEAIKLAPLVEIMRLRGDLSKMLPVGVILRGAPAPLEMQWPLGVYSNVATVLERIVRELA
jgi:hypothetical protein